MPSGICGSSVTLAGEKELEKRVKGMTKEKAEKILLESEYSPPKQGGWRLIKRRDNLYRFQATDNEDNDIKLFVGIAANEERLFPVMFLQDPKKTLFYTVINHKTVMAKIIVFPGIDTKTYMMGGFDLEESLGIYLNRSFALRHNGEMDVLNIGPQLFKAQMITVMTQNERNSVVRWRINNPEALYAAAFLLKPGISYKDFLKATIDD